MEASIRLGTIRGIQLGIHFTWFIALVLFSFLLARGQFPDRFPGWTDTEYWVVGVTAVLMLFVSVVVHEFGHALTAQARGIPVLSITLFIFGGVAALAQESEDPGDEFLIAIAGPLASVGLAGGFGVLWAITSQPQLNALFGYLSLINLALAIFNMIPGFPLDGGRVLRAILWKITGNLRRATRIVTTIGSIIGTLFFVLGALAIIEGATFNGVWFIALGWFMQSAAQQGYQQVKQQEMLQGRAVADIMNVHPVAVPPDITVSEFVSAYLLRRTAHGAPVVQDGQVLGIVTISDVKRCKQEEWPTTRVSDIMTPFEELHTVDPGTPLNKALQLMTIHDLHQIPVLESGRLVGVLSRADFMRYLQLRSELGIKADGTG
ncbi:MAG TPA: site-2 protease family protein [Thermomicrobiales bacterium]|nr:site-2 protease family protein [Thermomicrobiales bacterium]